MIASAVNYKTLPFSNQRCAMTSRVWGLKVFCQSGLWTERHAISWLTDFFYKFLCWLRGQVLESWHCGTVDATTKRSHSGQVFGTVRAGGKTCAIRYLFDPGFIVVTRNSGQRLFRESLVSTCFAHLAWEMDNGLDSR